MTTVSSLVVVRSNDVERALFIPAQHQVTGPTWVVWVVFYSLAGLQHVLYALATKAALHETLGSMHRVADRGVGHPGERFGAVRNAPGRARGAKMRWRA
jgi:hypothetical protein